jgi:hypothetical protein
MNEGRMSRVVRQNVNNNINTILFYPSELFKCRQAERHVLLKPAIYV